MQKFQSIINSHFAQLFIIAVIVLDSISLGFISAEVAVEAFGVIDSFCLYFFVLEMATKILAFGGKFFRSKWNVFDLFVVVMSAMPIFSNFLAFRLFRILKITRLFSAVPHFRFIIAVTLKTLPNAVCIGVILLLIFYIYAILGVQIFANDAPSYFGTLGTSLSSLFQIMTGDAWSDIMRAVANKHEFAWVYFVSFIVFSSFIMLNMVVGIIVESINEIKEQKNQALRE